MSRLAIGVLCSSVLLLVVAAVGALGAWAAGAGSVAMVVAAVMWVVALEDADADRRLSRRT